MSDLERKITRIHAFAAQQTDAQGVAEASASQKRAVRELVSVLQALRLYEQIRRQLLDLLVRDDDVVREL